MITVETASKIVARVTNVLKAERGIDGDRATGVAFGPRIGFAGNCYFADGAGVEGFGDFLIRTGFIKPVVNPSVDFHDASKVPDAAAIV